MVNRKMALKPGGPLARKTPLSRETPLKARKPLSRKTPLKTTRAPARSRPQQSPIRKSARGQPCLVRVPGVCNGDPETVVLAHLNGAGMGLKSMDHEGAFACSACHAWLDGGYANAGYSRDTRDLYHLQGVIRTQRILIQMGLIKVKGHEGHDADELH